MVLLVKRFKGKEGSGGWSGIVCVVKWNKFKGFISIADTNLLKMLR